MTTDKKLPMAEAIELLGQLGVSAASVAMDAKINPGVLSSLKGGRGIADYHIEPLRQAIHKRALKLRRAPAKRERLYEIIKECNVSMQKLGEEMGVSRQAVLQWLTTEDWNVSEENILKVQAKLREIGDILYEKSKKGVV